MYGATRYPLTRVVSRHCCAKACTATNSSMFLSRRGNATAALSAKGSKGQMVTHRTSKKQEQKMKMSGSIHTNGRTVYLNGSFLPEQDARISVFDRGFLFADAVYEVSSVLQGKLLDFDGHVKRLERSLEAIQMPMPLTADAFLQIHRRLIAENSLEEGVVYLQITRGNAGDRNFLPTPQAEATVVLFTQKMQLVENPKAKTGIRVVSIPDQRWKRCDIKTTQLLYQSLSKMNAKALGVDDAWMLDSHDNVTEGTSNNAFLVLADGTIVTKSITGTDILHGITRAAVVRVAAEMDMQLQERAFSLKEVHTATEAFSTSASSFVMPVVELDGVQIGDGKPGPVACRLREIYIQESLKRAV